MSVPQTPETPAFIRAQHELTRHLRDPTTYSRPPALPEPRVAVYRKAVIHNIERFMADNFPRIKEILDPGIWESMIRDYFIRHRANTPTFAKLPQEFLDYLRVERQTQSDPPFLYELAHFDWLENVIATDERRIDLTGTDVNGALLDDEIAVNPIHRVEVYRFPILALGPQYQPALPPTAPTNIVAFRDAEHRYAVLELNAVALQLFTTIKEQPRIRARTVLLGIAAGLGHPTPEAVIAGGLDILSRMRQRGLILGTQRAKGAV
ncbi:MAG: DUF2063 domain-containing protein [Gammaproteobacteria bacterium]|nr:DUF2063 domain-containing protein [Gammaproteobacteria bacterium]